MKRRFHPKKTFNVIKVFRLLQANTHIFFIRATQQTDHIIYETKQIMKGSLFVKCSFTHKKNKWYTCISSVLLKINTINEPYETKDINELRVRNLWFCKKPLTSCKATNPTLYKSKYIFSLT